MSWIFYSLAAAVILSVVNTVDKIVLSRFKVNPRVFMVVFAAASLVFAAGIFIFKGFVVLPLNETFLCLLAGALVVAGNYLYFEAAKRQEISKVVGLWHLAPLHTLVLSYFLLGEVLTPDKYLGVIMIALGAVLLSVKRGGKFFLGLPFFLMLAGTFFTSLSQVITKYTVNRFDYWPVFAWIRIGGILAIIPLIFISISEIKSIYKAYKISPFIFMSFSESFTIIAFLFVTIAISIGPVTLATAMVSVQPLMLLLLVTALSAFWPKILKEDMGRSSFMQKFFSISMMVAGVVLIS